MILISCIVISTRRITTDGLHTRYQRSGSFHRRISTAERLDVVKNWPMMLQATRARIGQGNKVRMLLAGNGSERENLESMAKNLKLRERNLQRASIPARRLPQLDGSVSTQLIQGRLLYIDSKCARCRR